MDKKSYVTPGMEVVELKNCPLLNSVSQTGENPGMHYGEQPGEGSEIEP